MYINYNVGLSYALSASIESIPVTELDILEEMDRWTEFLKRNWNYDEISCQGNFLIFPCIIDVARPALNIQVQEHGPTAQKAR